MCLFIFHLWFPMWRPDPVFFPSLFRTFSVRNKRRSRKSDAETSVIESAVRKWKAAPLLSVITVFFCCCDSINSLSSAFLSLLFFSSSPPLLSWASRFASRLSSSRTYCRMGGTAGLHKREPLKISCWERIKSLLDGMLEIRPLQSQRD